jgi:hypothetical protein
MCSDAVVVTVAIVMVSVESAVPLMFTVGCANEQPGRLVPVPVTVQDNVTAPAKPCGVMLTVDVAELPLLTDTISGDAVTANPVVPVPETKGAEFGL